MARPGGDEFVIVLPDATFEQASAVGTHIVASVRHHFENRPDDIHRVTASAGIAMLHEAREKGIRPMLLADQRLYAATRTGRDRLAIKEAGSNLKVVEKGKVTRAQAQAIIDDGAITLVLQPIQNPTLGTIDFAEALMRVVGRGENISTGTFIEGVEQAGLGPSLDEWVLSHGIALLGDIQREHPHFRMSLNVSGQSMGRERIAACVEAGVKAHRIRPGSLILEITATGPHRRL